MNVSLSFGKGKTQKQSEGPGGNARRAHDRGGPRHSMFSPPHPLTLRAPCLVSSCLPNERRGGRLAAPSPTCSSFKVPRSAFGTRFVPARRPGCFPLRVTQLAVSVRVESLDHPRRRSPRSSSSSSLPRRPRQSPHPRRSAGAPGLSVTEGDGAGREAGVPAGDARQMRPHRSPLRGREPVVACRTRRIGSSCPEGRDRYT